MTNSHQNTGKTARTAAEIAALSEEELVKLVKLNAGYVKALEKLFEMAKLQHWTGFAPEIGLPMEIPVEVPSGMSSLFKTIVVSVEPFHATQGTGAFVEWRYAHHMGSNGHFIGGVAYNAKTDEFSVWTEMNDQRASVAC
jgi:hypothetical protein